MMATIKRSLFLLMLLCIASSTAFSQNKTQTSDFTEMTGKVVDSSNRPIEKFSVNIVIYDYNEGGFNKSPKNVGKWNGEFENGEFSFDVEKPFEIGDKTYMSRSITADGYLETNRNGGWVPLSNFKGKIATVKLSRAVKIRGQVILPDGHDDEAPIKPKVYISKKQTGLTPNWNNMFQHVNVDEEGKFEATVPENCKIMLSAYASNAATTTEEFKVPKSKAEDEDNTEDLGEVKLKPGVAVSGVVLDRDGDPVEGQIIKMEQTVSHTSWMQMSVNGYAQSDADGKFTLPPRLGKCDISLVEQGTVGDVQTKAKGNVLMAKPVKLTLKEGVEADEIEIKEGKTWTISGTITYEGEKPNFSYSMGSGSQKNVELDSDGQFEFEVVDGVKPWIMMYKNGDGTYYQAKVSTKSLRKFRQHFQNSPEQNSQFFQFKKVSEDIGPLEFKMVKHVVETRSMMQWFEDWYFMNDID